MISCYPDLDDSQSPRTVTIEGNYTDSVRITDFNITLGAPVIINAVLTKQLRRINDSTLRMCTGTCGPPLYTGTMDSLDIIIRPDNSVRTRFVQLPAVPLNNQGSYYDPVAQYFYIKTEFPTGWGSHVIFDRLKKI